VSLLDKKLLENGLKENILNNTQIIMYQSEDGKTKLENETLWLTIDQMSKSSFNYK